MFFTDFELGDRVKTSDWLIEKVGTNFGKIKDHFCDYGEHRVGIVFDNGKYLELDEYSVEEVLTDHYEYAIMTHYDYKDEPTIPAEHEWGTKEQAEDEWLRLSYLVERSQETLTPIDHKFKIVKRRKAGKVEYVEET